MFEWLQGDPVNGILMTMAFFSFLIIGRQLKLRQIQRKARVERGVPQEEQGPDQHPAIDRSESALFRLDARVKFICAIVAVFGAVALTNIYYLLIPIVACMILAVYARAPLGGYFSRLLYPLSIALLIAAIQFFSGIHSVLTIPYLNWNVYSEGLIFGTLIFMRVIAAASILNLLITVTPMETLLDSLAWFRIPSVILDTMMLMYRYIAVVNEEKARIFKAQQSRCGYIKSVSVFRKLTNYGTVGGMLLVKSFDRAIQVGNAMVSRGYTGTSSLFSYSKKPFKKKDVATCAIVVAAVVVLVLLNYKII
jgi:cobalt/nickel transport system permease protein